MLKVGKINLQDKKTMAIVLSVGILIILGFVLAPMWLHGFSKEVRPTILDRNGNPLPEASIHLVAQILEPNYEDTCITTSYGRCTFNLENKCDEDGSPCIMCNDKYTLGVEYYYYENGQRKKAYESYTGYVCKQVTPTIVLDVSGPSPTTTTTIQTQSCVSQGGICRYGGCQTGETNIGKYNCFYGWYCCKTGPECTCVDSDGGKDIYTKGKVSVTKDGYTYTLCTDRCYGGEGSSYVLECFCESNEACESVSDTMRCSSGYKCSDGRCVRETTTTTQRTTTTSTTTTSTTSTTLPPECDIGDKTYYVCGDGTEILHCVCLENNEWDCLEDPASECEEEEEDTEWLSILIIGIVVLLVAVFLYKKKN